MTVACQESIVKAVTVAGDRLLGLCNMPSRHYRTCGTGCALVIAYCDEHGGDARAVEEMKAHVGEIHESMVDTKENA